MCQRVGCLSPCDKWPKVGPSCHQFLGGMAQDIYRKAKKAGSSGQEVIAESGFMSQRWPMGNAESSDSKQSSEPSNTSCGFPDVRVAAEYDILVRERDALRAPQTPQGVAKVLPGKWLSS